MDVSPINTVPNLNRVQEGAIKVAQNVVISGNKKKYFQGQWNWVRRVHNCAPTFHPNGNYLKLTEEKSILKISQKLTELEAKM